MDFEERFEVYILLSEVRAIWTKKIPTKWPGLNISVETDFSRADLGAEFLPPLHSDRQFLRRQFHPYLR